jgi:hypothetical protein
MATSWNYPTVNQAEEAALDAMPKLVGGQIQQNKDQLIKDTTCIVAYGVSIGFPVDDIELPKSKSSKSKKAKAADEDEDADAEEDVENTAPEDEVVQQFATAIQPIADHHEKLDNAPAKTNAKRKAAPNVDWQNIAKLALQFLLSILSCVLLFLLTVVSSRGQAQAQAQANSFTCGCNPQYCGCNDKGFNCGCFGIANTVSDQDCPNSYDSGE